MTWSEGTTFFVEIFLQETDSNGFNPLAPGVHLKKPAAFSRRSD